MTQDKITLSRQPGTATGMDIKRDKGATVKRITVNLGDGKPMTQAADDFVLIKQANARLQALSQAHRKFLCAIKAARMNFLRPAAANETQSRTKARTWKSLKQ